MIGRKPNPGTLYESMLAKFGLMVDCVFNSLAVSTVTDDGVCDNDSGLLLAETIISFSPSVCSFKTNVTQVVSFAVTDTPCSNVS